MGMDGELWHIVDAKRDDGTPTTFRIRELEPLPALDRIFVVEMPYPALEMSGLPSASAYKRLDAFDAQWLRPACAELGWELVGSKVEDGSFFLYMYGARDPNELVARLSPFDANLGFYDDHDPQWLEYGVLRELLDQAKAIPLMDPPEPSTQPLAKKKHAATKKHGAKAKRPKKPAKKPTTKLAKKPTTKLAKKPTKKPAKPRKRRA